MTFVVGPRGSVFQKDLGESSEEVWKAMVFDPDSSRHLVH